MESSNSPSSQFAKNICIKLDALPNHHQYLQQLLQAESLFMEDDSMISNSSTTDTNEFNNFRKPVEKILSDENSELSAVREELKSFGVKNETSLYIFKLLASYTIKNSKRFAGSTELKVTKLQESLEKDLPFVYSVLSNYAIPYAFQQNSFKTVIRCSLNHYRNNFFDLVLEDWSCWDRQSGLFSSAPYVSTDNNNKLHIFIRDKDKNLLHSFIENQQWNQWNIIPGPVASAPCAAQFDENHLELFVKGEDNTLLQRSFTGSWSPWRSLRGNIVSAPCECLCENGELHIFARGVKNDLVHIIRFPNGSFSSWESLGGELTSAPTSVSWGGDRIDVFARGTENRLYQLSFSNSKWGKWVNLGGFITSAPGASSRVTNRLDVFARGSSNQLLWRQWNGVNWGPWLDLGGYLTSAPASISQSPDRIDVFAKGAGNQLIYISNK